MESMVWEYGDVIVLLWGKLKLKEYIVMIKIIKANLKYINSQVLMGIIGTLTQCICILCYENGVIMRLIHFLTGVLFLDATVSTFVLNKSSYHRKIKNLLKYGTE